MHRLHIVFISFFIVIQSSFGQETAIENDPLTHIIKSDSLSDCLMNRFVSKMITNAKMQIQGAGEKEKEEAYIKFIKDQLTELSQTYTTVEIAKTFHTHFTNDEIKELLVFFETPAGKNMLGKMTIQIGSLYFESIEKAQTYNIQLNNENMKDLKVFYKTPTGDKFSQLIAQIMSELMSSLSTNYIKSYSQKLKKELARLDSKIWREAYRVKPEQVIVYKGELSGDKKLIRIQNDTEKNETYLTFAVPIYENKFWIRFDKNTEIVDKKTNERYLALRLDNDLILNKTMIVSDHKEQMIEVTMVFPLLKKSIKKIDIIETTSEDADLMSNNSAPWSKNTLVDLEVKKYQVGDK